MHRVKNSQPPKVTQHNTVFVNRVNILLSQEIPAKIFSTVARVTGNKKMIKESNKINKALKNVLMVNNLFGPLASKTWIY